MVGNIYLAKIYFTDLSEYKIRPILVIKELKEDCICLQLTSQIDNQQLLVTVKDLTSGSLKKDSLVVIPKNFTLHKSILFKYLATINKNLLSKVYKLFCKEIGCGSL